MLSHERTDRSLMGSVTTVHPTVTVVEGDDWIRARVWRDTSFEAQKAGNICVHLIVASVGVKPGNFAIRLDGVCGAEGGDSATEEQVLYNTTCSVSKSRLSRLVSDNLRLIALLPALAAAGLDGSASVSKGWAQRDALVQPVL